MIAVLRQDIVIPAGTVFGDAPVKTTRTGEGHIDTVIGLTTGSAGRFEYCLDDPELDEWFDVVEK